MRASVGIEVHPDQASLANLESEIQAKLAAMDLSVDVQVGADTRVAAAELAGLQAAYRQMTMRVDADTAAAAAQIAALRGTIPIGVNARGGRGGGPLGGFMGAGILNAGALGLAALPAAGTALASIGADVQALTQGIALLPGLAAAAGAGIATLVVGMRGFGDALGDDPEKAAEAIARMAPAARESALALREYRDELGRIRQGAQQNLWEGSADPLRGMLDAQLPVVETGMEGLAARLGEGMRLAIGELGSDRATTGVATIFRNSADGARELNAAVVPLISSLGRLAETGSTFLPQFGQGVANLATRFDAFLTRADETGNLTRWMQQGIDATTTFGSVIANLGSSLSSIFRAVRGDGDGFLVTVDAITERWAQWLKSTEGQVELKMFFQDGREQMEQWQPVLASLGGIFGTVLEATQAWSAILLPFLQAATGLIAGNETAVKGLLIAWLAFKTLSPVMAAVQSGIASATAATERYRDASNRAATGGADNLRRSAAGLGAALGTSGVLGLGIVAASIGLSMLATRHQEAARAAEEQKRQLEALRQTLDDQTGAVTEQTISETTQDLLTRGFLERAETLGVNPRDYVRAGLGLDNDGRTAINEQITGIILEQRQQNRSGGSVWETARRQSGMTDEQIAQALQGIPSAVEQFSNSGSEITLTRLKEALNDVAESAATLGGEMNGLGTRTGEAREQQRLFNETINGTHTLTDEAKQKFDDLGVSVKSVPDARTIEIASTTDEQREKLQELGYTVTHMPDGTVKINLDDEQAKAEIREIVKPETKPVSITYTGEFNKPEGMRQPIPRAAGGSITGGIPGQDSVPILAMPGEHVLTTSDVDRLGGQSGVYRFRAALQAGLVRGYSTGGAVGWSREDELKLEQAQVDVIQAEEKATKVNNNPKSSEADKREAQIRIEKARLKVQELENKKAGRASGGTDVLPQAPLPGRRSSEELDIEDAQSSVDEANTKRNAVYADPNSTPEERAAADRDYQRAQNRYEDQLESRTSEGETGLPEEYTLPGILGAAGNIIGQGILAAFGLENSILSGSNPYNRGLNSALDFYTNREQGTEGAATDGYSYEPKNLPVDKSDESYGDSSVGSSSSSEHAYDPAGGVEQWRPTFASVLAALSLPASWIGLGLAQMNTESGGNPKAINNWDSNAAKGIPSKGLMQVIDPTFAAYRSSLYPNDIWDPGANIAAALQYLVARYGGPEGVWGVGRGYADGGWVFGAGGPRSDSVPARLSPGEFVVNAAQAAVNRDWLEAVNAGLAMPPVTPLPSGMTPRGGDTSVRTDRSLNLYGSVNLADANEFIREMERHQAMQMQGEMAVLR
ncbi:transglycosylase SLT domain-containing protein [Nocardia puris]|uniref:transglycosylase SLT domain-containing protein n=1 Tax=Nocardia puris TaxID=208602 RepID=UPI002E210C78